MHGAAGSARRAAGGHCSGQLRPVGPAGPFSSSACHSLCCASVSDVRGLADRVVSLSDAVPVQLPVHGHGLRRRSVPLVHDPCAPRQSLRGLRQSLRGSRQSLRGLRQQLVPRLLRCARRALRRRSAGSSASPGPTTSVSRLPSPIGPCPMNLEPALPQKCCLICPQNP